MADRLVELGRSPVARRMVGMVGVSLPPELEREPGPWVERPLEGRRLAVLLGPKAELAGVLAPVLARAGGEPGVVGELAPFLAAGEAWGRPARALGDDERVQYVVLDATGLATVDDLRSLYALLHPRVRGLAASGRVVVLARPPEGAGLEAAAVRRGIDGFVRSLAREVGRKGSTANLVLVTPGAEDRLEALLRWLLSPRSAFVSGQPFRLTAEVAAGPVPTVRPLAGKVALVTGAGRGIGAATARALAREGAKVVVHDRPGDTEAEALAAALGGRWLGVELTDPEAPARIAEALADGVDVVVHNAGVTRDRTLGGMSPEQWDLVVDVNLRAVLRVTEALLPRLRDGGRVVCLSSIGGIGGNVGQTNYAATKAGILGLVEALAPTLAPRGVAVNAVAPGFIETRMTAAIPFATREVARRLSNLSQGGLPEDVAELITFLASPGASGLCGRTVRACGGNLLGA